ncbi:MAG: hypothetical protein IKQ16_07000 [Lentisphaeria bacterium]|nr:hypothetical protein [Lentisphaeria bacterium]
MKRTMIATLAAVAAVLAAAYLTGADGMNASAPQAGMSGSSSQALTPAQQIMQAPALETEECTEGYILLMPCPVCHTCPVCQANCGTTHVLKCCLGNKKPACPEPAGTASGTTGTMQKQHIMTNKAEAVKHAAGHPADTSQTDEAVMSVISIEAD